MTASTPTAPTTTEDETRNEFYARVFEPLGHHGAMGARIHGRSDFTGATWDDALAWLRGGITVTIKCVDEAPQPGRWGKARKHKIRLHTDGTVEPLNCQVIDLHTELVMAALGGHTPDCVAITAALTHGVTQHCRTSTGQATTLLSRVGALHAAVGWAQRPDTDWTTVSDLINHRIHPETVDTWVAHGWTLEQAKPFLITGARQDIAVRWRDAGQTTHRVAALAAQGLLPDSDDAWTSVGFTPAQAHKWRTTKSRTWTPSNAKRLHDAGYTPGTWANIQRALNSYNRAHPANNLAEDTVLTWASAGVPAQDVVAWWEHTNGDIVEALRWSAAALDPHAYRQMRHPVGSPRVRNLAGRVVAPAGPPPSPTPLDPAAVRDWIAVGAPSGSVDDLRRAISSGITPAQYAAAMAIHPHRDSMMWWFTERLDAAVRFLTSGRA